MNADLELNHLADIASHIKRMQSGTQRNERNEKTCGAFKKLSCAQEIVFLGQGAQIFNVLCYRLLTYITKITAVNLGHETQ